MTQSTHPPVEPPPYYSLAQGSQANKDTPIKHDMQRLEMTSILSG